MIEATSPSIKDKNRKKTITVSSEKYRPLADIYGESRASRYTNPIQVAPKKAVLSV